MTANSDSPRTGSFVSEGPVLLQTDVRRTPTLNGAMLYDASRAGNASADFFRPEFWSAHGAATRPRTGRGTAWFVESGQRSWVLRHYRRGGAAARVTTDRYLWTGERRTRPFREWRLLFELHAAGLPVPAPVAARYQRSGLAYTGDLITERIANADALSARLAAAPLPTMVWEAIGRCVRRFHDAGVDHADLNAHNILIEGLGGVFVIDFDRGRRRRPGAWVEANLQRLKHSLDKIAPALPPDRISAGAWQAFLRAYRAGARAVPGPV